MKNVLFVFILVVTPFHGFCQADESPQKSGSFYIETVDITGALSETGLNPMVGYAVSDNFVLGLGISNIVGVVVDGFNSYDQQNLGFNLGGRYFTQSNLFFGGSAGISGSASGSDNSLDDFELGVSLRGEIGKYLSIGNHFYAAPKLAWTSAAVGDDEIAVGVAGTQIAVSLGVRLN